MQSFSDIRQPGAVMGHVRFKLKLETAGQASLTATQHDNLGSVGMVLPNSSVSMPTTRLNFSATSHPVRPRFMRSGVCPHIGLRAKEATRNPQQPHKSLHHTATPLECTSLLLQPHAQTTVQLQVECLSILMTHASAPLSLPRSVDPLEKQRGSLS